MVTKRKYFIVWLLGLISGFTLMISGNTLNFWLAKEGIDIRTIGVFALVSLPYSINFIWAPIFDTKKIPVISEIFGHRLSWVIIIQVLLSLAVYLLSMVAPSEDLSVFAVLAFVVSFLSSAQDTVLGALRTEIIDRDSQGAVSGMYIFGYRIGMLISSSGAIYLSVYLNWNLVYELFSLVVLVFPVILMLLANYLNKRSQDTEVIEKIIRSRGDILDKLLDLVSKILSPVGSGKFILLVMLFLVLYRLPDNFITHMINPFLIHIGYDEFEIASFGKFFGVIAAIFGGLIAGSIMEKINVVDSMLIFGVLHGLAHLLFIGQELYGNDISLLFFAIGAESITGGMSMAAYIAFIASLCKGKFRATQYSFFSAMMGFSRSVLPAFSGYMVANLGWINFFIITSLATMPALALIPFLKKSLKKQINK